jgi:naphtho-gamma-pyrone polyketide synthase
MYQRRLTFFFRFFGEGSKPYPNITKTYLLGLCTGSFAAAAISTSQTLSELLPAGIEAVLVAFRTALRSFEIRNDIESPLPGAPQSWSVVVSAQEDQMNDLIEAYSLARVRLIHKHTHGSANKL